MGRTVEIDAEIGRAETPPGWFYSDAGVYERTLDRVLRRSWQLVGDSDSVKVPGQVFPFTLLEGSLDEPLVLTRDFSDRVHCLSNVCTHRGTILCPHVGAVGHERALVCRYHGRRFDLDGKFRSMPEFEGVAGFPSEKDNLARAAFGGWGGGEASKLVFASLEPAVPLAEWLRPVEVRCGWLPLHESRLDPGRSRDYLVNANWMLYIDNYLEGFHIPFVHAGLNQALDYGEYTTELHPWGNLQLGIAKGTDSCFAAPAGSPDRGRNIAAYYWWLFPNTMLNFYPWGLSVNVVRPLGVDRTRVSFLSYVWDESKLDAGAGTGLDRVEREDEAVVEAVHKGLRSRLYGRGRYSVKRETGVHQFHRLMCGALWGGGTGS
jgi:phenylpropionate dioxygenase-like ring-hydroxylating dioxygenase large terminal subunit